MIKLNTYITEAWNGVKKHTNNANIEAWCDEMGIQNYIVNSKGEIDVKGGVSLDYKDFKDLPYKFGTVTKSFDISSNQNLTSLKNCPNHVGDYFSCSDCTKLDSLEGCPKEVRGRFFCMNCKRRFTKNDVQSLCKVKRNIYV